MRLLLKDSVDRSAQALELTREYNIIVQSAGENQGSLNTKDHFLGQRSGLRP